MPRNDSISKILIIGSGPIVIGQACEFDYSGVQACKALREEGYEIVLVNSNPATIMTDPEIADRTYVEPLTADFVSQIIAREKPDALLPTVGGQTALNLAVELAERGDLEKHNVEMIGARLQAVKVAEDRLLFKQAMAEIGLKTPSSAVVGNMREAERAVEDIGYPVVIRPSFTLGGTGGGIAFNSEEYHEIVQRGLDLSPVHSVLIEQSVLGWKEYELEVMRDVADNVVIICSIENFDPMGVHTGDSITVAPAQTLTDREYQRMRDAAVAVIRKVGVETGGSNIQFAVDPKDGTLIVIEMNPRVSRSSALASKATGFPIAKIAAKLAVGYTLDEIPNDITKKTPASFEPMLDYVVVKIPKWAFEKFRDAQPVLGTQMKSVGEVMAIGRTFREALGKGIRSLETGRRVGSERIDGENVRRHLMTPNPDRLTYLVHALSEGMPLADAHELTGIDPWFLRELCEVVDLYGRVAGSRGQPFPADLLREAKRSGLSDERLGLLRGTTSQEIAAQRKKAGLRPVYKRVDTCAAEFASFTPYMYSTYEDEDESAPSQARKIIILGSGPNRIGQGIEFDYCCCHAAFALKEAGYETIMVNCNPETVSTDYDTSDRLYFEPLTLEDVLHIAETEQPEGMIVQFGGQTPLNLALDLQAAGVPIIGTSPQSIDLAEDRKRFGRLLTELGIPQPPNGTAVSLEEARRIAEDIGYPVLVRPSYVLGGRAMVIAFDERALDAYMNEAVEVSRERPILIDRFLEGAVEVDVDALCDGERVVIGGIMQHIEEAGVHSGDSSCVLPAHGLSEVSRETIRRHTVELGRALNVIGLMNIQFAVQGDAVFVIEVNPRASRTVPFVSKATGVPLAKVAARLMTGARLEEFNLPDELGVEQYFVKSPVFPFARFAGVDPILGPEMKSTGEVMGIDNSFGKAYIKAQISAGTTLPRSGTAFLSVNEQDKKFLPDLGRELQSMGFRIIATAGTAAALRAAGVEAERVFKVNEGRPHIVDKIKSGEVDLVINTPLGRESFFDEKAIRRAAMQFRIPCITTLAGGSAAVNGIRDLQRESLGVRSLQEYHSEVVLQTWPPAQTNEASRHRPS
jgi:carbamoyl-phosphate synthase large subunit